MRGKEREWAVAAELQSLQGETHAARSRWLAALQAAVPSRELALGKHIDCTAAEYRDYATIFLDDGDA
jgi:hypothetical protein